MAKIGRPKKENPRNEDINIRLTRSELDDIQFVADNLGLSRTDAIMHGISELKRNIEDFKQNL